MSNRRTVRIQLTIFALVAVVTISMVALRYAQLLEVLGWGRYEVTTTLPRTGGLTPISLVTYRGVSVGKVKGIDLGPKGVLVRFSVDSSAKVPANVVARVHSMNAIGEQFLDLEPVSASDTGGELQGGDRVTAAPDAVPVEAGALLANANSLITSVDPQELKTTVDEVAAAFGGRQQDIGTLIDSSSQLMTTANENLEATKSLLADLGPVLGTQAAIGPDITSTAYNLKALTQTLALSDGDLRALIAQGPAAVGELSRVVQGVHPTLPIVLANLTTTGQVLTVYDAGTRQLLVLLPATYAELLSTGAGPGKLGGRLNFRLNIQNPRGCREGFVRQHRDPSDLSTPTEIADAYCKEPASSPLAVRGARNSPCPNGAGRSATAAGCGLNFAAPVRVTTTAYDPATGEYVGADGSRYQIGAYSGAAKPQAADFLAALSAG